MTTSAPETTAVEAGRRPQDDELDVYALTHPGLVRKNNQDHFLICSLQKKLQVHMTSLPEGSLPGGAQRLAYMAMVADGVGGAAAGEEASRLALEGVTKYVGQSLNCYYRSDPSDDEEFVRELAEAALKVHNELEIAAREDESLRGMATTLTLWIGVWPYAYLLQVGDSRCYQLSDGELVQLSRDQTMAEELVEQGVFTRADAGHSKWAHVLSSAIGGPQTAPVVRRMEQRWDTVGLLCSDGLTRHVPDERIRDRLLNMTSSRQACEVLLQDALDAGGQDNITIVVGRKVPKSDTAAPQSD